MMTNELGYLIKATSDCEGCGDQESLCVLLADLRVVADDLDLDFAGAYLKTGILAELRDQSSFCPCI
jgi:hypothetical protein